MKSCSVLSEWTTASLPLHILSFEILARLGLDDAIDVERIVTVTSFAYSYSASDLNLRLPVYLCTL